MSDSKKLQAEQNPPEVAVSSMRVCFCHGVSEEEILKAIKSGAKTVEDIQKETLASTGCGGCIGEVERILSEALDQKN